MDGFTFYKSYYETLKKIRKKSDRAQTALAVLEFMFEESEPKNLTEMGEIAFASFRRTLEISRVRAKAGGSTKQNQNDDKNNSNENQNETNEIKGETRSRLRLSSSLSTPPISPPNAGEGDAKSAFFEKYPALKGKRVKDDGIDYAVLIREFEQSSKLRGMYSFAKVVQMYEAIARGDLRDKDTVLPSIAAANAKAAREKWYADKRAIAESNADGFLELARRDRRFFEIERRLSKINLDLAKAEVRGDSEEYETLEAEQTELLNARLKVLDDLGIYEWRLVPQYECKKCNDSGFLPDGKACDCYKGG